jgi:transposase
MAGTLGRPLVIEWLETDTAEALARQWRRERDARTARRLRALWLVRSGHSLRHAAEVVGVEERTVGVWLRWYRHGGLVELRHHRQAGKGHAAWLSTEQQAALLQHLASGAVYTAQDAIRWVAEQFQVTYRPAGMYSLLERLKARPKVPRPHNPKSTAEAQAAWKKGDSPTPSRPPG